MSSLRQLTNDGSIPHSLLEASGEIVQIDFDPSDGVPVESRIDDYPFDQEKYSGSVTYKEPVPEDLFSIEPEEYDFEYRDGSGLLIIDSDISGTTSRTIFKEINEQIGSDTGRFHRPETYRVGLWSFVFSSIGSPKFTAKNIYEEEVDWKQLQDLSQEEVSQDYTLDWADLVFKHNDERISVSYENGRLNFQDGSPKGKEYVIQLFEKFAIAGNALDKLK